MKKRGSFAYLTKEGFRSLWSNRLMSVASIAVLMSCMIIIGCASMIFININGILGHIEQQNVMMVFLEDTVGKEEADQLGVEIKALPNVKGCVFISKDSAWEKQMESLGEDAALLEGLGENPLPDAYKVTAWILPLWLCPSGWVQTMAWCPGNCFRQNSSPNACARSTVKPLSTASRGSKLIM